MLLSDSKIPLYIQIKDYLKGEILNGKYKAGQKIPTEPDIGKLFDVSRVTVRKAIDELVSEGYLVKKQGKGTFVNHKRVQRKMSFVKSFSQSCLDIGLIPSSIVEKIEVINPSEEIAKKLNITIQDKVIYIQRKRFADDVAIFLENNYFDYSRYSFLLEEDLNRSLYEIFEEHEIYAKKRAPGASLEIVTADHYLSQKMDVSLGTPFFFLNVCIQEDNSSPIHVGHQYYLGEYYKFDM
ncbi:GntR family transcriptional regulator [Streptococcus pluranimalium]|uniref:GntR family transcriptional regulator n=1 Tax=Streptococcus pluranimalium TaxID=82348 RepID=UPI003BF8B7D1